MGKNIVILFSGGIDSHCLYELAKRDKDVKNIKLLYYNYGSPVCKTEMQRIKNNLGDDKNLVIRNIDWFDNSYDGLMSNKTETTKGKIFIPGRNLVFAVLGACQYLPDEIWLGATYYENIPCGTDKNLTFVNYATNTLNYVLEPFLEKPLTIRFPLYEKKWDKTEIVNYMCGLGLDEIVVKSISCNKPLENGKECGQCYQCLKKFLSIYGSKYQDLVNNIFVIPCSIVDLLFKNDWFQSFLDDLIDNHKKGKIDKYAYFNMEFPVLYKMLSKWNLLTFEKYLDDLKDICDKYEEYKKEYMELN